MILTLAGMLLARFVTGQRMSGRYGTATFFCDGVLEPRWWSRSAEPLDRAGWKRLAVRVAILAVAAGLLRWHAGTMWVLWITGAITAGVVIVLAVDVARTWREDRHEIQPAMRLIEARTGVAPETLEIEREDGRIKAVEMTFPPGAEITSDESPLILAAVQERLAIEAFKPDGNNFKGRNRVARYTVSDPPPGYLEWPDVAALVASAGPDEFAIGLGVERAGVAASLATDSPHVGFNMGSGGGKTNLGSLSALQFLHRGDIVAFIDAKLISYPWARCLPNVAYAGMIPEIHDLLVWFGKELRYRNSKMLDGLQPSGAIHADLGARLILFAEELNFLIPDLKDHWAECREQDKSLPKRSPALAALRALSFAGRQAKMHVFFIGQMLTVSATGASDSSVRGNIGIACMARYNPNSWKTMSALPMPAVPTVPGRIQVVTAGGIRETQVPYLHLDDHVEVAAEAATWAREFAVGGQFTPCPEGMPCATAVQGVPARAALWPHTGPEQGLSIGPGPVVPPPEPVTVTLSEAVRAGLLGPTIHAARKARSRYEDFPEPVGERANALVYDAIELQAWRRGRSRVRSRT